MPVRFEGQVGIITGGASGIGRETVLGFARQGGIAIVAIYDDVAAGAVFEEAIAAGGTADAIHIDLRQSDQMVTSLKSVIDEFGRVDFLDNNAFSTPAGFRFGRVEETDFDQ